MPKLVAIGQERVRCRSLLYFLDNFGWVTHKRKEYYSYYYKKDISADINGLDLGQCLIIGYNHGRTLRVIEEIIRSLDSNYEIIRKTRAKVLIVSRKGDEFVVPLLRNIIKNEEYLNVWHRNTIGV